MVNIGDMDASVELLLREGLEFQRRGAFAEAAQRYNAVLLRDPANPDAYYYLASLACQQNRLEEGIELANRAIAIDQQAALAHCLIGAAQGRLGRNVEALAAYDRAIACKPDLARAHGGRGDALMTLGRAAEALASYDRAVELEPTAVDDWYRRAAAAVDLGRHEDALASLDRVINLQPRNANAHNDRANALKLLGRNEEALESVDRALVLEPENIQAQVSRAHLLNKCGRHNEALDCAEAVLARAPGHFNALVSRNDALAGLERFEQAIGGFDQVLAVKPDDALTKWNKSLLLLSLGRLAEGWALYESRWRAGTGIESRNYRQRRFDGSPVNGTVLVWGEQGVGDHILYSSMIEDLRARAGSVVLETDIRLVPLFARSFPGVRVIGVGPVHDPPLYDGQVDAQIALGSLGALFRNSLAAFPRRPQGHLVADSARMRLLRRRLANDGKAVIGLSWRSVNPKIGVSKSVSLNDFAPLLRNADCRFVDLQYGDTREDRARCESTLGVRIEHVDDIDNLNDIDGLAALIAACDLVVTISNATAHLSGALGKPTWVFVPSGHARIWYWFRDREDSPWYPKLRIRRQSVGQPWSTLIASTVPEIAAAAASRAGSVSGFDADRLEGAP